MPPAETRPPDALAGATRWLSLRHWPGQGKELLHLHTRRNRLRCNVSPPFPRRVPRVDATNRLSRRVGSRWGCVRLAVAEGAASLWMPADPGLGAEATGALWNDRVSALRPASAMPLSVEDVPTTAADGRDVGRCSPAAAHSAGVAGMGLSPAPVRRGSDAAAAAAAGAEHGCARVTATDRGQAVSAHHAYRPLKA